MSARCGRSFCVVLSLLLPLLLPAAARGDDASLYRAVTIVTGTEEPERSRGFAACLREVLVKLSGNPELTTSPDAEKLVGRANSFVSTFNYRDRMAGIPVHDEQGTRERPHFLTVEFSHQKIDAALRELGAEPWRDRPVVMLNVTVDNGARSFLLTQDGVDGRDQRAALEEAAEQFGLPIRFPGKEAQAAQPVLQGDLLWHDDTLRWSSDWSLTDGAKASQWSVEATSFDAVFLEVLAQTMAALSTRRPANEVHSPDANAEQRN